MANAPQMALGSADIQYIVGQLEKYGLWDKTKNKPIDPIQKFGNNQPVGIFQPIYDYIFSKINGSSLVDDDTQYWFSKAGAINANVLGDHANDFIRGVTQYGLEYRGKLDGQTQAEITAALQKTSNLIGYRVVSEILNENGIPDVGTMLSEDIGAAIDNPELGAYQQDPGGWGGSFYYWNEPLQKKPLLTVGQAILHGGTVRLNGMSKTFAPSKYEFLMANGSALADFTMSEHALLTAPSATLHGVMQSLSGAWQWTEDQAQALWTGLFGAQAPVLGIENDIRRSSELVLDGRQLTLRYDSSTWPNNWSEIQSIKSHGATVVTRFKDGATLTQNFKTYTEKLTYADGTYSITKAGPGGRIGTTDYAADGTVEEVARLDASGRVEDIQGQGLIASDGGGADTLYGSGTDDTFLLDTLAGGVARTIDSTTGQGTLWAGGEQLTGGTAGSLAVSGDTYTWSDAAGTAYAYKASGGTAGNIGTLTISGGALGAGNTTVIDHFDFAKAQSDPNGYLGIHVAPALQLALGSGQLTAPEVLAQTATAVDPKPGTVTLTAYVSAVSDQAQTLNLAMSQGDAGAFAVVGADGALQPLSGGVNLSVAPGRDSVSFTLVNTRPVASPEAVKLTVSAANPLPGGAALTSTLEVDYEASANAGGGQSSVPGAADNTIQGDLTPLKDASGNYQYDRLGNLITDGSPDPGFNDTLYGSAGNDAIGTGDGANRVDATQGGIDTITGGDGSDTIRAGNGDNRITESSGKDTIVAGNGDNRITGGTGRDSIVAGNGDNEIIARNGQDEILLGDGSNSVYGGAKADLATAIADGESNAASGAKGSFIAVGGGDNTLVGGAGNDVFVLGGGDDVVVCGPGNDTIEGGQTASGVAADWSTRNSVQTTGNGRNYVVDFNDADLRSSGGYAGTGVAVETNFDSDGVPVGGGSETVFGGAGDDYIEASNGPGNFIDVGNGESTVFSGAGSDTVIAGAGNSVINAQAGNDYVGGGTGDQSIEGGAGNNTIRGGAGDDVINAGQGGSNWATLDLGDNYVDGGTGNALIFGAGGSDTLAAGSGDSTVVGGAGQELIQGGAGQDVLVSGSTKNAGADTVVAGSGDTTLYGGFGADTLHGGTGTDVIYGGTGTEVIYAGDGGTAAAPTQVQVASATTTVYGGYGVDQLIGGSGSDTLIAGDGTATLQGGSGTELLQAGAGTDALIAGSGNDTLLGGAGSATLWGGSGYDLLVAGSGENTLVGGGGQNTYRLNAGFGDAVIRSAGAGDVLQTGAGITLADLTATGALDSAGNPVLEIDTDNGGSASIVGGLGGALAQVDVGGSYYAWEQLISDVGVSYDVTPGANGNLLFSAADGATLDGGTGNDTLVAFGEDTTLTGGGGDTLFTVNDASQAVAETHTGVDDTIRAAVSYVLPENVDNLTLTGHANLTGTGNDQADVLTANDGNDTLIAGSGPATLVGGAGDDTFVVNDTDDVVKARVGSHGTVKTGVSYVLPENVDDMIGTGNADIVLTGNDQDNATLTANDGNDTLIAGSGTATLVGGTGDDTFVVNDAADVVRAQGGGTNTVETAVSYVMPDDVQNLTASGGGDLVLTANGQADAVVTANGGDDTLRGGGGSGTLVGGSGLDTFVLGASGAYTAEKAAGAGAVVKLIPGLDLTSDVTAQRTGDDLLLQAGNKSSLRLQDYFLAPSRWTIEDARGNTATGAALVAATAAAGGSPLSRLETQFKTGVKAALDSAFMSDGYTLQSDGSWYRGPAAITVGANYTVSNNAILAMPPGEPARYISNGPPQTSFQLNQPFFSDSRATIRETVTNATASFINADAGGNSSTASYVWLKVNWGTPVLNGEYKNTVHVSGQLNVTDPNTGKPAPAAGFEQIDDKYYHVTGTPAGTLGQATVSSPGGLSYSGPFPQVVNFEFDHAHIDDAIQQIDVGAGDHTVNGSWTTLVQSGSGDNLINNAGFVDAGTGNDTINNADVVFCESGNDTIIGAPSMTSPRGDSTVYGGSGDEVITKAHVVHAGSGHDTIRNVDSVYGGSGDELIVDASSVVAGTGRDTIFGSGRETVSVDAGVGGMDLIGNEAESGSQAMARNEATPRNDDAAFLDAYYQKRGIGDGAERYRYGGMYYSPWFGDFGSEYLSAKDAKTYLQLSGYTGTLQQAIDDGHIRYYVKPLPAAAPLVGLDDGGVAPSPYYVGAGRTVTTSVASNDFTTLGPYFDDGALPASTVKLGPGITPAGLTLSWGLVSTDLGGQTAGGEYATLDVSWGKNEGIRVVMPHADDPIGSGLQEFAFADGTRMSMADMIAMAPPAPTFDPEIVRFRPGMGARTLPAYAERVAFASGVGLSDLTLSRDGNDLLLSAKGGGDSLRIPGGATDPGEVSKLSFTFADGTTTTYAGDAQGNGTFTQYDAQGDKLADLWIHADGTSGSDGFASSVFAFKPGMGPRTLPGSTGKVTFASGVDFSQLTLGTDGADLLLSMAGSQDSLRIPGGAGDPAAVSGLAFSFADGSSMDYAGDAQGDGTFTHYDAQGDKLGTLWVHADGSSGLDAVDPLTGASSGRTRYPDGTLSTYVKDGLGDSTTDYYDASGTLTGDTWSQADGSHGTDTFNADGSSSGVAYNPDGSGSTYTNDGHGDVTTVQFDSANRFVADQWQRADGSRGTDAYDAGTSRFTANYTLPGGPAATVDTIAPGAGAPQSSNGAGDTLSGGGHAATLLGFGAGDTLTAGAGGDLVYGTGDGDVLASGSGSDTLVGTGNNDTFAIGAGGGVDTVVAAGANDTMAFGVGITPDMISLGIGSLLLRVGTGGQAVHIEGFDPAKARETGSIRSFKFADGTVLTYDELLARGFDLYAGAGDVSLKGTDLDNRLYGGSGNDTLIGTGRNDTLTAGTGADTLVGGTGHETFVIDNPGDVVIAQSDAASNSVESSVSYVLPSNVRGLTLTGTGDLSATGNGLDNVLTGNGGNNALDGGAGADTMIGGEGDDSYVVDDTADRVVEKAGQGIDTVSASVDYVLPEHVENLDLTGSRALAGTGNALNNRIKGNSGGDTLIAGAGVDTLIGGSGDDAYYVDNSADKVLEQAGEGADTVRASVDYVLSANVEDLMLIGASDLVGAGNAENNELTGNAGDNVLVGGGGDDTLAGGGGNDTLRGGSGDDRYVYNRGDGLDTITDTGGANIIRLGAGLSVQNLALRLTTPDGRPYTVFASDGHGRGQNSGWYEGARGVRGHGHEHERTLSLNAHLRVLNAKGEEQAGEGLDFTVSVDRHGHIISPIQGFTFADGTVESMDRLLIKTDIVDARRGSGDVSTGRNDDIVYAGRHTGVIRAGTGNDIVYSGNRGTEAYGEGGDDELIGGRGNDTLNGGWGVDFITGGGGDDALRDSGGNSALLGGRGDDTLNAGAGNDFIAGGRGDDLIRAGGRHDVIAFDRGDGNDTVTGAAGAGDTLSLGHVDQRELTLRRTGDDLVVGIAGARGRHGRGESLTLADWYAGAAGHDIGTLQIIDREGFGGAREDARAVRTFDFRKLVAEYDQARAADPTLGTWRVSAGLARAATGSAPDDQDTAGRWADMDVRLDAHLRGSDAMALGGALAFDYAQRSGAYGLGAALARDTLEDSAFGRQAQSLSHRDDARSDAVAGR